MGSAFPSPGSIIGIDFASTIVSIHPQTTAKPPLRIGERVCSIVHGSHPTNKSSGAFANYMLARPELLLKVPSGMAIEEAATLGTGLSTNLQFLFEISLQLDALHHDLR
jgi:NADPH:quinone reductase-like Zn-dependent oxidoreductase